MESNVPDGNSSDESLAIASGLAKVRKRRWVLWSVLLIYLPAMMAAQEMTGSFTGALPAFFGWVVLLLIATGITATARCPRCGKFFHVNGPTMLLLRKCLHCHLHLTADKKKCAVSEMTCKGGNGL